MRWFVRASLCTMLVFVPAPDLQAQLEVDESTSNYNYGRMRMLVKRSSRQYTMYQYGIGELSNSRAPLLSTIDEFDRVFRRVRESGPGRGLPAISEPALVNQLEVISDQWARLEEIYTFQPYKLALHNELLPVGQRRDDPVLVRYVDRLTDDLLGEYETLTNEFSAYCERTGSDACNFILLETGGLMQLSESIATDILFAKLKIDRKSRRQRVREKSAEFVAKLNRMRAPDYFSTDQPALVRPVLATIEAYWQQLKVFVDLTAARNEKRVDIDLMLRAEQRLVDEVANLVDVLAQS